jgi:hypothetical protein
MKTKRYATLPKKNKCLLEESTFLMYAGRARFRKDGRIASVKPIAGIDV